MRLNPKIYNLAEGRTPLTTQEFDGRHVEIYDMNEFEGVAEQNLPKGKFALWTSFNGKDYRLFIEKGYYDELGDLYTPEVNSIWLNFWDECERVTKKYNFRIMLPLSIIALFVLLLPSFFQGLGSAGTYIQLIILAVFIFGMFYLNGFTKRKINEINKQSVDKIKAITGEKHFEELLATQNKYITDFLDRKSKEALNEDDEVALDNATALPTEEVVEDTKVEVVEEVNDAVVEDVAEETKELVEEKTEENNA